MNGRNIVWLRILLIAFTGFFLSSNQKRTYNNLHQEEEAQINPVVSLHPVGVNYYI